MHSKCRKLYPSIKISRQLLLTLEPLDPIGGTAPDPHIGSRGALATVPPSPNSGYATAVQQDWPVMGIYAAGARRRVPLFDCFCHPGRSLLMAIPPFDLATGPSAFPHVVRRTVALTDGYTNLLDDLIIWGVTVEEHDRRLRQILTRLQ